MRECKVNELSMIDFIRELFLSSFSFTSSAINILSSARGFA